MFAVYDVKLDWIQRAEYSMLIMTNSEVPTYKLKKFTWLCWRVVNDILFASSKQASQPASRPASKKKKQVRKPAQPASQPASKPAPNFLIRRA